MFNTEVQKAEEFDIAPILADMRTYAINLTVGSETAFNEAMKVWRQARDWKKVVEEKRKSYCEPFRKTIAQINARAAEVSDPLIAIETILKDKIDRYHAHLARLQESEAEKIRSAAALFEAEAPYIAPVETPKKTEDALIVTKLEKRFKLTDLKQVPHRYLMLNEAAVKQDLKLGIFEIPGLEIWEETTTQIRSR